MKDKINQKIEDLMKKVYELFEAEGLSITPAIVAKDENALSKNETNLCAFVANTYLKAIFNVQKIEKQEEPKPPKQPKK